MTWAVLMAAPTPVITPQPTSEALSKGRLLSIFTAALAGTTQASAMQPRNCMVPTSLPSM